MKQESGKHESGTSDKPPSSIRRNSDADIMNYHSNFWKPLLRSPEEIQKNSNKNIPLATRTKFSKGNRGGQKKSRTHKKTRRHKKP